MVHTYIVHMMTVLRESTKRVRSIRKMTKCKNWYNENAVLSEWSWTCIQIWGNDDYNESINSYKASRQTTHTQTPNLNNGTKANNLNASLNCIHTYERVHVHIFKSAVCNHVFSPQRTYSVSAHRKSSGFLCIFLGKRNECHPTHRLWKVNAFILRVEDCCARMNQRMEIYRKHAEI